MKEGSIYTLFIIGIILTVIVLVWLLFLSFSLSEKQPVSQTSNIESTPTPLVIPFDKPKTSILTIDGVRTQNFYKQGTVINTNGDVSIKKNRMYDLVYLAPFQEFIIDILRKPFEATRAEAEQAFLKELGITQQEACKLNVSIGTQLSVNPQEAGKRYKLSFCEIQ